MTRQTGWVVGAVALALSIYGVSQLSAQRSGHSPGEVHHRARPSDVVRARLVERLIERDRRRAVTTVRGD